METDMRGPLKSHLEDRLVANGLPRHDLPDEVNDWRERNSDTIYRAIEEQVSGARAAQRFKLPFLWSELWITKIDEEGNRIEYGLASLRLITTVGVNYLVDAMQGIVEPESMRFHGIGTGTNAESTGDTGLQTELTTSLNPDNTRATGTLEEGGSSNVFRTVGTNDLDAAEDITEHGVFDQASTAGGVLLDRSVFSAVSVGLGQSFQSTYNLTIATGG